MIILVCGKKQVGKDTFFNIMDIAYPHKFTRMKFAKPIYDAAAVVFGYKITEENKEMVDNLLGITPRKFMQEHGDMMKRLCGNDIFPSLLVEKIKSENIIITDCRFQYEIDYLKIAYGAGMVSIRINRPAQISTDEHISEKLDIKTDYTIDNNSGMNTYVQKVKELMSKIEFDMELYDTLKNALIKMKAIKENTEPIEIKPRITEYRPVGKKIILDKESNL